MQIVLFDINFVTDRFIFLNRNFCYAMASAMQDKDGNPTMWPAYQPETIFKNSFRV
jgi:hypothetical protein